ncbi:MAG: hypothetical protein KGL63_02450 [Betaproteobacteria bacterium]|nr:hypothetical protein [Betaproteobacteria bacterium]
MTEAEIKLMLQEQIPDRSVIRIVRKSDVKFYLVLNTLTIPKQAAIIINPRRTVFLTTQSAEEDLPLQFAYCHKNMLLDDIQEEDRQQILYKLLQKIGTNPLNAIAGQQAMKIDGKFEVVNGLFTTEKPNIDTNVLENSQLMANIPYGNTLKIQPIARVRSLSSKKTTKLETPKAGRTATYAEIAAKRPSTEKITNKTYKKKDNSHLGKKKTGDPHPAAKTPSRLIQQDEEEEDPKLQEAIEHSLTSQPEEQTSSSRAEHTEVMNQRVEEKENSTQPITSTEKRDILSNKPKAKNTQTIQSKGKNIPAQPKFNGRFIPTPALAMMSKHIDKDGRA